MMNPNALPQSATLQDFQQFGNDISSPDYNDTLNAMQYMQSQRQPQPMTSGLNTLPQVTVPMQEGGGMEQAMMQEQMMQQQAPQQPEMSPEMQQEMMQRENESAMAQEELKNLSPEEAQQYEMEIGQLQESAKGLAALGREGDNLLVHMNPEELEGLSSLGTITYNPITGLPEAFGLKRFFSKITKPIRRVVKSKAFKTIAPIALAIAAPYALGALAPTVFGTTAMGAGMFASGTALGAAATAGLGSLAGNLLAGRKFGDAAKAALITGATAGAMKGVSNRIGGKTFFTGQARDPVALGDNPNVLEKLRANQGSSSFKAPQPQGVQADLSAEGMNLGDRLANVDNTMRAGQTIDLSSPDLYSQQQAVLNAPGGSVATNNLGLSGPKPIFAPNTSAEAMNLAGGNISDVGKNLAFGGPQVGPVPATTIADVGARNASAPLMTRLGNAKDAVLGGLKDRYTLDLAGAANLGKDVIAGDIGSSYVDMSNQGGQPQEDADLEAAGYSVSYPSGFGGQKVIRDSSGVVTNLSAADILSRALGGGRNQYVARTTFAPTALAAQGGLIQLAQGGEFSGMVPGDGGGMEDNVYMPIKEGSEQVGTLAVSPSEYVVDSYTMAALGNGNPAEGAKVMDNTIKQVRKQAYGSTQQPNEINGLSALRPMAQGV